MVEFLQKYDLLVTPSAPTAAFDVNLRAPADHQRQEARQLHVGLDAQLGASPSPAARRSPIPCGFDQWGRPTGLQLVGKPRGEAALLQAASLFERLLGLAKLLPIDPKPGTVPPSS